VTDIEVAQRVPQIFLYLLLKTGMFTLTAGKITHLKGKGGKGSREAGEVILWSGGSKIFFLRV
jgi:hypothetical protein